MGKHAIAVVKNEKGEYLQYFDEKWNCYLFLNCKFTEEEDSNIVKEKIANSLEIDTNKIQVSFVGKKQHRKFSESAKIEKEYTHYFYNVKIDTKLNDKEFELKGLKYKWFSYSNLMKDERIKKVNSDIIQFVKEFNM